MISLQLVHHNHNNNLDLLLPRCGQPYSRTHVPPPPAAIPTAITGTYTPCWAPVAQTCTLALTSRRAWALVGMTSMSLLYFTLLWRVIRVRLWRPRAVCVPEWATEVRWRTHSQTLRGWGWAMGASKPRTGTARSAWTVSRMNSWRRSSNPTTGTPRCVLRLCWVVLTSKRTRTSY